MTRLRHAAAATFLVYVAVTLFAAVPTLPLAASLGAFDVPRAPGGGALLEIVEETAPSIGAGLIAGLGLAAVLWLLSPLLQMTWLGALVRSRSVADALAFGASHYFAALLVTLVLLVPLAIVAVVLVGLPAIGHFALATHPNDRMHDLVVVALLVPGGFLAVVWCTWHDLARAALAAGAGGARKAVRAGLRRLGVRSLAAYLGWWLLAALLALVGHWLGLALDGPAWWRGALVLALLQLLALARVACRGAWLGSALDRVGAP